MNEHMEAAVMVGMAAAYGGNCCPDGFDCECEGTQYEKREVTKIITAALPHIRAMIADDIRTGADPAFDFDFDPRSDYARGYRQGIRQAAKIAEAK